MAIGMIFDANDVTEKQYDQVRAEVMPNDALPNGMLYHAAGPREGGWSVVEVWSSEADARRFFDDKLNKALERAKISVKPKFFQVHAIVK